MYMQVLINSEDRKFQYILWRYSNNEEIKTYCLNTVTYGTSAAPFLAVRTLHYLADEYSERFEIVVSAVKNSFYVDDFLCGAETIEELAELKYQVTELLKMGCFEHDKWHSNHENFRHDKSVKDLNLDGSTVTNALGISWDQQHDQFLFSFSPKLKTDIVSKRSILSLSSALFDPLGLVSPLIIKAKIILQELWILKVGWDESVPQDIHTAWQGFLDDLQQLPMLNIPRYCLSPDPESIQLHGFCDSSIRAYGCCIYIRVKSRSGAVSVQLFTAKSKVAPTKRKSLPSLELCVAHLLSRLYTKIQNLQHIPNSSVFLWTDSQIVLHWLKLHSSTLSVFVGNRISEIQDSTNGCNWRHVPSHLNPADIVSRGSRASELMSSIWFTGPSFLVQDDNEWPVNKCSEIDLEEVNREKRKTTLHVEVQPNRIRKFVDDCSSYTKVIRVVAWILRFRNSLSSSKSTLSSSRCLQPQELEYALLAVVWHVQQQLYTIQHFKDDIRRATKKRDPEGSLKGLNPFIDCSSGIEILKVGGRLKLAQISESQKHPMIMTKESTFLKCYIQHLHIKNYHAGPKALVSLARMRFWNIKLRSLCRTIVNRCPHCIRYRPKLLQQIMSNLPAERLNPAQVFARLAVDFCGSINTAPHFGGLREAAVKSAKGHLTRTLANTRFTYEELVTALVEIEAIMNSRPISPLSSDPSGYEALTPGHFITGGALRSLPEQDQSVKNVNLLDHWAQITNIKQRFWKKWSHEYINELQENASGFNNNNNKIILARGVPSMGAYT
uniref:DUF5641 domain-containing protein n=1 Tax=Musca domestica TaxID=7370 RepID=A0A1I8MFD0_MUSDO